MKPSTSGIRYRSTRSVREVGIETAIAEGLSPDGGLYVPTRMPQLPARVFDPAPLSYAALAHLVLAPFFPGWEDGSLERILYKAYGSDGALFSDPDVAPLRRLDEDSYLIELFYGQTCAFKDFALSVMGGLLRESLDRLGIREEVLVLAATSGDTGSATLAGFSSIPGLRTGVLFPDAGTSEIQALQMTTAPFSRCFVARVRGNFDDAQRAVKAVFTHAASGIGPCAGLRLSSANSINIGRLLPQIVYYVQAWRDIFLAEGMQAGRGDGVGRSDSVNARMLHVAVPTGNFGDILAARYAKMMGLPLGNLLCASNANHVLADFFATGHYDRRRSLEKTESPSMDILVSSNLERLLFSASGEDPDRVCSLMKDLADKGYFDVTSAEKVAMSDFLSSWVDDAAARNELYTTWTTHRMLVDPHTAVALCALRRLRAAGKLAGPVLTVATASPFKFPRACVQSIAPEGLSNLAHDLELAQELSEYTGVAMPSPLRRLTAMPVLHNTIIDCDDIESALAAYMRTP